MPSAKTGSRPPAARNTSLRPRSGQGRRLATVIGLLAAIQGHSLSAACVKSRHPIARFEAQDNEVREPAAGLIWERCSAGEPWQAGRCAGTIRLMSLAEARRYAAQRGLGWRLPTLCWMPSIDWGLQHLFSNAKCKESLNAGGSCSLSALSNFSFVRE